MCKEILGQSGVSGMGHILVVVCCAVTLDCYPDIENNVCMDLQFHSSLFHKEKPHRLFTVGKGCKC